jgi:hypothetical protein
MNWPTDLRYLAFIKRAVIALESIAASQQQIASLHQSEWDDLHAPLVPRKSEFGTLDIAEVNRRYQKEREAQMIEIPEEER